MKRNAIMRIALLVLVLVGLASLALGAVATVQPGDVNGDGVITVFDAQLLLEAAAGVRQLSAEQQDYAGSLHFDDVVQMILKTSAIARVETNGVTSYVDTVAEMVAAVDSTGNTQITLLQDISTTSVIVLPYSCTIDFNGHTISTNPESGNGLQIKKTGSANQTTTLMNGTLLYHTLGVRLDKGAIVVDNMNIHGLAGACVGFYDTTDYSSINRITNSTLSSAQWGCITFNEPDADFSNTGLTIDNTTMLASRTEGSHMLVCNNTAANGTVTFGYNVHIYSYKAYLASSGYTLAYSPNTVSFTKVTGASATINGTSYEGLTYWSTPTGGSSENALAQVTNGTTTTNVYSVDDMVAAVSSTGNTKIKLLSDVTTNSVITVPYSCTIDLNGHTITTNLTSGNGLSIQAAGSQNKTTTIKNGKLVHSVVGVRVGKGAVVIDNMEIESLNGPCVGIYDPSAEYKSVNSITNSTLTSPYACLAFNASNTDFSATGISIANSNLISHKNADGKTSSIFVKGSGTTAGSVIFGENVNMYAYNTVPALSANSYFNGNVVTKMSETVSVTANGVTYEGINCWTTELEPIKILCIGNSFNLRLVQEVYGLAAASGREIYLTNLYYGGCSVERHWKSITGTFTTEYAYWIISSLGHSKHATITTITEAIEYQDWDIITLQQHFDVARTQTFEKAVASCTPYVENIYNYLRTEQPNAKLYWYQTWAYAVGYTPPEGNSALPCPDVATQSNQQEQIIAASNWISETYNVDQIPCGSAWKIVRANPEITLDPCLLTDNDYCHDGNVNGGQYLNACVWLETLLQTSCLGNTYDPSENDNYTLDDAFKAQLQQAAHQAVAALYGEDYAK